MYFFFDMQIRICACLTLCWKQNTERTEIQWHRRVRLNSPSFSVTINGPLPSPGIKQRASYMHKIQCKVDYICSLNWLNAFKWDLCFFQLRKHRGYAGLNGSGDTIDVSREQLDWRPLDRWPLDIWALDRWPLDRRPLDIWSLDWKHLDMWPLDI